ncbi:hypothetical protein ACHAWF_012135 [Thalassiosira exigua]
MGKLVLQVGNLPSNRLALTNKVYLSPKVYGYLVDAQGPERQRGSGPLVTVGPHAYVAEGNPGVPDDKVGLNAFQRRFAQLSLSARVEVRSFSPPPDYALAALEVEVDLLQKKAQGQGNKPKEIDTDRLASDFLLNYEGMVFEVGQPLAMDFEGTKVELKIAGLSQMDLTGGGGKGGRDGGGSVEESVPDAAGARVGQYLQPTSLTFSRPQGSKLVALVGDKVAGGSGAANTIFLSDFDFEKLGIGGLDAEFNQIFRRAFASRIWPAHVIRQLGINHVRGMLLFGPPGCGKTLIARQIGKVLNAREPKIVNGPEILDKYVGGSEEKVRELFAEAEKEQLEMGDQSMLHIVILDEMDAICKSRGSNRSDSGVSDSVVNQLLSKIDGVDSLNNILLIGMTNRKDMIDDALLRPGRLEVHVEIGLPDEKGRLQILGIHTKSMRDSGRIAPDVLERLGELSKKTKNFSGAEIEGLIKAATSYALTRCVDVNDLSKAPDERNLVVRFGDFERALENLDVKPKFGAKSQELRALYRNGFVPYGDGFDLLMGNMERLVEQGASDVGELQGPTASGKTAVAAKVAAESGFPFVRMISADDMISASDMSKCQEIHRVFLDSYKSPLSLILIDVIERIIDYVAIGPRFSNVVLQTLLVLLKKVPPDQGRRLLVVGTTSCPHLLQDLGLVQAFGVHQGTSLLEDPMQVAEVLRVAAHLTESDAEPIGNAISKPIGIKTLLMVAEMAKQGSKGGAVDVGVFLECLHTVGY